ncbi:MAG: YkgJ family cysteine cluster protein [Planctomycetaceae bacterium]|nr:YkgJ family cysteine cluster protein [Planctomycetaceae bacterium]
MSSEEFLCAQCARHQTTCCQKTEIYVTLSDVKRITEHTGTSDFYEYQVPVDPVYHQNDDDPDWNHYVFRPDGTRRVLRHQPNQDCTFLTQTGCSLPLEVRPLICRLHPWAYTAQGIQDHPAGGCPVYLLPPNTALLPALDMNRLDAERWHRQLYAEIKEPETSVTCISA